MADQTMHTSKSLTVMADCVAHSEETVNLQQLLFIHRVSSWRLTSLIIKSKCSVVMVKFVMFLAAAAHKLESIDIHAESQ